MKKLISVGIALAVLAMVVLPVGVAAADVVPTTYAKIPFAIVESTFYMLGCLMGDVGELLEDAGMALPIDLGTLTPIFNTLGAWTGKPLAWSVDMMAWGMDIVKCVVDLIAAPLGLPGWIEDVVGCITEGLRECYPAAEVCNNVSNTYRPCP